MKIVCLLVVLMCVSSCISISPKVAAEIPVIESQPAPPLESVLPTENIPEPVEPETQIEEPITAPQPVAVYDVPLSAELQQHIISLCDERNVDPELVIAIIKQESNYKPGEIGDNGKSFGLMQIQPRWHGAPYSDRMDRLGVTDLLDPYQNVIVGIDILAELQSIGKSTAWVLMAYNGGYGHANAHIAAGTISNYASSVLTIKEGLK